MPMMADCIVFNANELNSVVTYCRDQATMTSFRHLSWMDDMSGDSQRVIGRNWVSNDLHSDSGYDSGISSSASSMSGSTEDLSRDQLLTSRDAAADSKFRLLTYNILTDHCIRPGQYTYCPPDLRYMDSRHVTIMAEVKAMNPDVICFQV